ncbi:MAG TPA: hypothetical protein DIT32_03335 [Peptococcaceae bacterium]|nr:hypothetical protein [Peptococcaceae bacterium]
MRETIGLIFVIIGSLFYVLSSIGLIRMPDVFNRIQASTKATTLGNFSILLGVGIYEPDLLGRVLLMILFISLKSPIGSSVLTRAAYYSGAYRAENTKTYFIETPAQDEGGEQNEL